MLLQKAVQSSEDNNYLQLENPHDFNSAGIAPRVIAAFGNSENSKIGSFEHLGFLGRHMCEHARRTLIN